MERDDGTDPELTGTLFAMALYKLVKKHTKRRRGRRPRFTNRKIKFKRFSIKATRRGELMIAPYRGEFHISMYIDDETGKQKIHMTRNEGHGHICIEEQLMDQLEGVMSDSVRGASAGSNIGDLKADGCVIAVHAPTIIEDDVMKIPKGFDLAIEANTKDVSRDELAGHDGKIRTVRGPDGRTRRFFIVKNGRIRQWGGDAIGRISKKMADAFRLSRECSDSHNSAT